MTKFLLPLWLLGLVSLTAVITGLFSTIGLPFPLAVVAGGLVALSVMNGPVR